MIVSTALATSFFAPFVHAYLYDAPIKIRDGYVQGHRSQQNTTTSNLANWKSITSWKGIPFAASTAGNNRWKKPQPPTAWKTTLNASSFGPGCPTMSTTSGAPFGKRQMPSSDVSEDCLTVNVWSPATSAKEKLPVAVWSYGAGTTSSDSRYDGAGLASKGIVFVTYNYRSGPLGWLTLPELAAEDAHNKSGNYGLYDQIYVLEWIRDNIAAFGGNPNHVTTVGQSFGTGAVLHQINSPLAQGLIHGAVAESGIKSPYDPNYSTYGSTYVNYTFLYPFSEVYRKSLNLTTLAQLRAASLDTILGGTGVSTFGQGFDPVLDGVAIPYSYEDSLIRGPANDVPVLVGNNRDEDGVSFSTNYTVAQYHTQALSWYSNNTYWMDVFLSLYPASTTAEATIAYKAQLRDQARVSTWMWASQWAKSAKSLIYTYEWTHAPPGQDSGAFHASEIPYALNTLFADTQTAWQSADYTVASTMSSYWANFIKTGNPNQGGSSMSKKLTTWPASKLSSQTTFNLAPFGVVPLASKKQVNAIETYFHNVTTQPF